MKLRAEANRGGRTPLLHSGEAVGRTEVAEPQNFAWLEVTQEADLIGRLFEALKESEGALEKPESQKFQEFQRHRERLSLAFYLNTVCRNNQELQSLTPEDIEGVAEERASDRDFPLVADDYLAGKFSGEARIKILSTIEGHLKQVVTLYAKIWILYALAIGVPDLLKKFLGILTPELPRHMQDLRGEASISTVEEVAMLVLLYPEQRGELLSILDMEAVVDFNKKLNQQLVYLNNIKNIHLVEARHLIELLFFRQVLAAQEARILPNGDVELTPPAQRIQSATSLPDRSIH